MSTRPDLAGVLAEHLPRDRYRDDGECVGTYCTCGEWTGDYFADGEAGPFDAHVAAALNAAIEAWLADEGTREAVARAISWHLTERTYESGCVLACGYDGDEMDDHLAAAALAALTTPTTTEPEEGKR